MMLTPGRVFAFVPWAALGQTVDLPPINFADGTWWVKLLVWFLTAYGGARVLMTRSGGR